MSIIIDKLSYMNKQANLDKAAAAGAAISAGMKALPTLGKSLLPALKGLASKGMGKLPAAMQAPAKAVGKGLLAASGPAYYMHTGVSSLKQPLAGGSPNPFSRIPG